MTFEALRILTLPLAKWYLGEPPRKCQGLLCALISRHDDEMHRHRVTIRAACRSAIHFVFAGLGRGRHVVVMGSSVKCNIPSRNRGVILDTEKVKAASCPAVVLCLACRDS